MSNTVIQVDQLSKSYGNHQVLHDLSLSIPTGSITALLGANGAGKTTLIQHLLGRLLPQKGDLEICGHKPGSYLARSSIGTIMQSTEIPGTLTVFEHVELFSSYYPSPLPIAETLAIAQLTELANKRFDTLSGGQQQRVYFAIAICGNPQVILLDEPSVGLDASARRQLWLCINGLREKGKTVLLTTHYLEEAETLADRLIYLHNGQKLFDGTCKQFKQRLGGKRISCRTSMSTQELSQIDKVTHVETKGDKHILFTEDEVASLKSLFKAGQEIRDVTVTELSLEDAVLHLEHQKTQEHAA